MIKGKAKGVLFGQKQREKMSQQALLENRFIASFSTVESKATNEDHLIQLFLSSFIVFTFPTKFSLEENIQN